VVSPLLVSSVSTKQYTRRKRELSHADLDAYVPALTFSDMRLHKVPDTVASGAFTGGIFSAWKLGKRRSFSGAITAGLVCGVLQLVKNECQVQRIKFVSRRQDENSLQSAPPIEQTMPWPERLLSTLGFQKISDDEYLQRMIKQRDVHLARITELEHEIEEERSRSLDKSQS